MTELTYGAIARAGLLVGCLLSAACACAQWTRGDYERALDLQEHYDGLVDHMPEAPKWIEGTNRFVYRENIRAGAGEKEGGFRFVVVDADRKSSQPAFDAQRLAESLTRATGAPVQADRLPFKDFRFVDAQRVMTFTVADVHWTCRLEDYSCTKDLRPADHDPDDEGYDPTPKPENSNEHAVASPDGKWTAYVLNNNLVMRSLAPPAKVPAKDSPAEDQQKPIVLSMDGSADNYYAVSTIAWSPDSKHIAIYRIRPGYRRVVDYVESSPPNQLQPIHSTMVYPKAGDVLAFYQPVLFDVVQRQQLEIDSALFPNQFSMSPLRWWKDGRGFTFEYNQRGHQLYRVVEVDAATAKARALIDETSKTFVNYEPLVRNQFDHGKHFRRDLADGKEILWASERDGWEHLYLLDGKTGAVRQQITRGPWVVRSVDHVDEQHRTIYFSASGMGKGEDPYYVHGYKIRFDGSGLTPLTPEPADHTLAYSGDGLTFTDLYSTVNTAPTLVLRSAVNGAVLMQVQTADLTQLIAAGWQAPEPFHALGRDGKTDIWGVVYKPEKLDSARKYPVIEDIYAGPQGSFVPKSFSLRIEPLTALGFAVAQIDGMGTNNRSRAFHDAAWQNLKDAGFPDRILWHKALATKYPWYDITRVGVFGTSAGGQSAMGALLFHPEFYLAAVSNSGCHDNRMDKIWWNEQWMGWPVGPQYAASSNVDNAWRLQGKLMLVVGEMDTNVDPSSTYQVVDRLIKADKQFDLLVVPGGGHGAGGRYGQLKLMDFFVRNVSGEKTPDWNRKSSGQ
ncbi:MAG: prolyl oligopeptidase family serine peptidase [Terracidiphilus sp.]